jgi:hypothetical protein
VQLTDIAWQSLKRRRSRFGFMLSLTSAMGVAIAGLSIDAQNLAMRDADAIQFSHSFVITAKPR